MKSKIITWLITLMSCAEIVYSIIGQNATILEDWGLNQKTVKLLFLSSLIWNAFSEKLKLQSQKETDK